MKLIHLEAANGIAISIVVDRIIAVEAKVLPVDATLGIFRPITGAIVTVSFNQAGAPCGFVVRDSYNRILEMLEAIP